jgi:hypothetical protein
MSHLKTYQSEAIADIQKKIEDALSKMDNPTEAAAEKAVADIVGPADLNSLIPYTGYYNMNTAGNAFLAIDTTIYYINYPLTQKITLKLTVPQITISYSLDGKKSSVFPFDKTCSFNGKTLIIPNVLQVDLTRVYQNGVLVTFSGNIQKTPANGSTSFNPVYVPTFIGTYIDLATQKPLVAVAESSMKYDFGDGTLKNISIFSYNPAMYVVQFANAGTTYTLMLGTNAQHGLACFYIAGAKTGFAVTIP